MIKQESMEYCTGCSACKEICPKKCIEMQPNQYGFLYPVLINETECSNCGLCDKVCPLFKDKKGSLEQTIAYAAYNKDNDIRYKSSSGGVFTEVAKFVLQKNGSVFGAIYDEEYKVIHCRIEKIDDLDLLRGAKYAQSDLQNIFNMVEQDLKKDKYVLFSGTPCQVAGLNYYLKLKYEKLICIDFVCHSVPSPLIWKNYVKYRAQKDNMGELPIDVNLRSKHTGWTKYSYSNLYTYANNKQYSQYSGNDLFMKLFVGNYINRDSCSVCQFKGYQRISDITLADFWGIWDIDPELDDNKGTSLILLHSEKGKEIFNLIKNSLISKEVSLEDASKYNPSLVESSTRNSKYIQVLNMGINGKFDQIDALLKSQEKISLTGHIKWKIKKLIGCLLH